MRADVCAVIVAGGSGQRFGNPGGKQLIDVAGRPLMSWSLLAFDAAPSVAHIVVVCPAQRTGEVRSRAVDPLGLSTPVSFAAAGETRQDSTRSGLAAVPDGCSYVAIHDGARPLVTPRLIERAVRALREADGVDGVVCGQPAVDTLKLVDGDDVIRDTPPRSCYWTVQTPQIFSVDVLRRAEDSARAEGFTGTDDASLVERAGGRVLCVEGPRDNLKVTLPEDLPLVEFLLRRRES